MVGRAIASACEQDYGNIETVVVDDNEQGSADREATARVVEELSQRYPNTPIRLVLTDGEIGAGAARNQACAAAGGEYLCFLDDDDVYLPTKVGTQLRFMLDNHLDMSYQDIAWYDAHGKLVELRKLDHARSCSNEDLLRAHLVKPISPTSTYMLSKSLFDKTEGFGCTPTGQDWFLMLRCIEAGASIGYMPGVHVHQSTEAGDRLSVGKNKIAGETIRHEAVRERFSLLSPEERRYAEFRHYAVLAVACMRAKMRGKAIAYAARSFAINPGVAVREAFSLSMSRLFF